MKGVIKTINRKRGFGFITFSSNKDVFFHANDVSDPGGFDNLRVHDWVSFALSENIKGESMAADVCRVMLSSIQKEAGNFNQPKIRSNHGN